jgi:hypothetical protein
MHFSGSPNKTGILRLIKVAETIQPFLKARNFYRNSARELEALIPNFKHYAFASTLLVLGFHCLVLACRISIGLGIYLLILFSIFNSITRLSLP